MSNIWMPLHVADYLADTGHLSTIEHGAYLLLIMHYWHRGAELPDDDLTLAQICRMRVETWRKHRPKLERFFTVELGRAWCHDRIDRELEKAAELREKKVKAGNASYNARSTRVQQVFTQPQPPIQSKKNGKSFNAISVVGKNGNGEHVTLKDPSMRLQRFQQWLATKFPDQKQGWLAIMAASDSAAPDHATALELCKTTARTNGKGWPRQWSATSL